LILRARCALEERAKKSGLRVRKKNMASYLVFLEKDGQAQGVDCLFFEKSLHVRKG
jgi:hypothetical protein